MYWRRYTPERDPILSAPDWAGKVGKSE